MVASLYATMKLHRVCGWEIAIFSLAAYASNTSLYRSLSKPLP